MIRSVLCPCKRGRVISPGGLVLTMEFEYKAEKEAARPGPLKEAREKSPGPAGNGLFRWPGARAWLPAGVLLWGMILAAAWLNFRGEYLRTLHKDLETAAHHLNTRLAANDTILSLFPREAFEGPPDKRVDGFLANHPEIKALIPVDVHGGGPGVRDPLSPEYLEIPPRIIEGLLKAGTKNRPVYSEVYGLTRGEGRFAALIPLGGGEGRVVAEYSLEGVLRHVLLPLSGDLYRIFFVDAEGGILSDVSSGPVGGKKVHGTIGPHPISPGILLAMTRRFKGGVVMPPDLLPVGGAGFLFLFLICGHARRLGEENRRLRAAGERYREVITRMGLSRDKLAHYLEKVRAVAEMQDRELAEAKGRIFRDEALVEQARLALTALRNVGNSVSSLGITASMIMERVMKSRAGKISIAAELIDSHKHRLAEFFAEGSIGCRLPSYFTMLSRHLNDEKKQLSENFREMSGNIDHIVENVAALGPVTLEKPAGIPVRVPELLRDAVRLSGVDTLPGGQAIYHDRPRVRVEAVPEDPGPVMLERTRVLAILVDLMKKARDKAVSGEISERVIRFGRGNPGEREIWIQVADHGARVGEADLKKSKTGTPASAPPEEMNLRRGIAAAKDMGGSLSVTRNRPGKGISYVLRLPYRPAGVFRPPPLHSQGDNGR